jgi:hypothetical protein
MRRLPIAATLGVALAFAFGGVVWAATLVNGSGTIPATAFTVTSTRQAGPITIVRADIGDQYTGFLSGHATGTFFQVIDDTSGTSVFHGTEVCTCTVAGRTGTVTVFFEGTSAADGSARGQLVVSNGTGGLRGLAGQATFQGPLTSPSYAGQFVVP